MTFALRPYQDEIIAEVRVALREAGSALVQSATGSGKTALSAHMAGTASRRRHRVWFIVHRRELIKQSTRTFGQVGIPHGIVAANFQADPRHDVQLCSIQTLVHRMHRLPPPRVIIWDECHHLAAGSWSDVHAKFPNALHVGLSATPERLDGTGLGKWFARMVRGPSVAWLIEQGYLAPYRLFAPKPPELDDVNTRLGDFVRGEVSRKMDSPRITGNAIEHYKKHAMGKRAVVFACSVDHSRHIVEQFLKAGIRAEHVDGETDNDQRDNAIQKFERGEIEVLSNVELFGEGFDLPALEVAILLRPTQSLTLYLQQVGRALRPSPGKTEAIILDHAGNALRHGLPDDDRDWTLEGRQKKRRDGEYQAPVKMCLRCFLAVPAPTAKCKYCGFIFPVNGREVDEVAGELEEVDKELLRRQRIREEKKARTEEDLVALATARGYRNPEGYAKHVLEGRKKAAERYARARWGT